MSSRDVLGMLEAARFCGVDRRTMLRWAATGRIPSHKTAGGHHRVLRDDLLAFMAAQGMEIPGTLRAPAPLVLVVDDQDLVRRSLKSVLRRLLPEIRIEEASSGFDAGMIVAREKPRLVFLDIVMPGMDGVEVVRRLRDDPDPEVAATNVVVISGALTEDRREVLQGLGVKAMLDKPATPAQLREAMAAYGVESKA